MQFPSVLSASLFLLLASSVVTGCVVQTTNEGDATGTDAGAAPAVDGGTSDASDPSRPKGPIVRTLVYHHLTAGENGGVDATKGIAFSRDGSTGLFNENDGSGYRPTVVQADGTGRHALDAVSAGWIDMTALSPDGTLAAYTTDSILVSSIATPSRVTGPGVSQGSAWSRWAKDPDDAGKWRLYFTTVVAWGAPIQERGIYSAASDGTKVKSLMTPAQAAAVTGVSFSELAPKGGLRRGFDVSADGKRFVGVWSSGYCTQSGQKDYIIAASTDGSVAPRLLAGPITAGCGVSKLALSGDGSKVAYAVETVSGARDLMVMGFDGNDKKDLGEYAADVDTDWGMSDDGSVVLAGYQLRRTDGSSAFDLVVRGGSFSSDAPTGIENQLGVLNGAGNRVFYIDGQSSPARAAMLEIDPPSTGTAPMVSEPTVAPASIARDGSESATITAKVSGKPLRVAASVLENGSRDATMTEVVLFDDGTHGDATANDGVYTSNEIHAMSGAATGARTIRIRATVVDTATKAHSTVIEYTGLSVR